VAVVDEEFVEADFFAWRWGHWGLFDFGVRRGKSKGNCNPPFAVRLQKDGPPACREDCGRNERQRLHWYGLPRVEDCKG
jgi:hypothetical protein